jgi:hypothetical protein
MRLKIYNIKTMINEIFSPEKRSLQRKELTYDLSSRWWWYVRRLLRHYCCYAKGIEVALIQDRPMLGGNASSEVRVWVLGATSHMGNNNRWSREGGVIDEILVENTYQK